MNAPIQEYFSAIAPRYDLANTVLSLGFHLLWKRRTAERSGAGPGDAALDCATGTGDLAILLAQLVRGAGEVVACDLNDEMLTRARRKEANRDLPVAIEWDRQDLQSLTYETDRFDVATVGFGLRNVDDPATAIEEVARVVKPGGRVAILEFGEPHAAVRPLYRFYRAHVLPRIGGLLAGRRDAYEYLDRSVRALPSGEEFLEWMRDQDVFDTVRSERLTAGIARLYTGSVRGPRRSGAG